MFLLKSLITLYIAHSLNRVEPGYSGIVFSPQLWRYIERTFTIGYFCSHTVVGAS
jgi:hypothetical protein